MKKINLFEQMDRNETILHWFISANKPVKIQNGNNWGELNTYIYIAYIPFKHTLQKRYIKEYVTCNEKGVNTYKMRTEWIEIEGGIKYLNNIINNYRFTGKYKIDFYM